MRKLKAIPYKDFTSDRESDSGWSCIKIAFPWILTAGLMILIFCLSAQKAENSLQTSGGFAEFLASMVHDDFESLSETVKIKILGDCQFIVRKMAHFSVYAMLGVLSLIACRNSKFKLYGIISAAICLMYAISDEIHQYFVEGRSCELRDVMIDFSGALTGIAAVMLIIVMLKKIRGNKHGTHKRIGNF